MTLNDFAKILKNQEKNLRIIKPENEYETRCHEDKIGKMIYASLKIVDPTTGFFTKSVYRVGYNSETVEYLGFQANDNNAAVYPYDSFTNEDVQAALWMVWKNGVNV